MPNSQTILLIEDGDVDRYLLSRAFSAADSRIRLHVAISIRDALNYLHQAAEASPQHPVPNLVVVDVRLLDGSGIGLVREMRQLSLPNVKIVVTSAFMSEETKVSALRAGADEAFQKPETLVELNQFAEMLAKRWIRRDKTEGSATL